MFVVQHTLKSLRASIDGLKGEYAKFRVEIKAFIQDQANILQGEFQALYDELLKLHNFMQDELRAIHIEVEEIYSDWALHKCTIFTRLASTSAKLGTYNDARNATIVDNFFFGLE